MGPGDRVLADRGRLDDGLDHARAHIPDVDVVTLASRLHRRLGQAPAVRRPDWVPGKSPRRRQRRNAVLREVEQPQILRAGARVEDRCDQAAAVGGVERRVLSRRAGRRARRVRTPLRLA